MKCVVSETVVVESVELIEVFVVAMVVLTVIGVEVTVDSDVPPTVVGSVVLKVVSIVLFEVVVVIVSGLTVVPVVWDVELVRVEAVVAFDVVTDVLPGVTLVIAGEGTDVLVLSDISAVCAFDVEIVEVVLLVVGSLVMTDIVTTDSVCPEVPWVEEAVEVFDVELVAAPVVIFVVSDVKLVVDAGTIGVVIPSVMSGLLGIDSVFSEEITVVSIVEALVCLEVEWVAETD